MYLPLLIVIALSALAAWVDMINVLTLVGYELEQGPFMVGTVAISMILPLLFFGPLFSKVSKRFSFTQVMIVTFLGRTLCSICLFFTGNIVFLIAILLCRSFLFGFMQPSIAAYASQLPKALNVAAAMSLILSSSKIIAPAIGGVLSITAGEKIAFLVSALLTTIAFILLVFIKPVNSISDTESKSKIGHELRREKFKIMAPMTFIFLVPILFIDGLSNFFSNIIPHTFSEYDVPKITLSLALSVSALGNILVGALLVNSKSSATLPIHSLSISWFANSALFAVLLVVTKNGLNTLWTIPIVFFLISGAKTLFDVRLNGFIFEQSKATATELSVLRQSATAFAGVVMTVVGTFMMESVGSIPVFYLVLVMSALVWVIWYIWGGFYDSLKRARG